MYDPYQQQGFSMAQPWSPTGISADRLKKKMSPTQYAMMQQQMSHATQKDPEEEGLFSKLLPYLTGGIGAAANFIPGGNVIGGLASLVPKIFGMQK